MNDHWYSTPRSARKRKPLGLTLSDTAQAKLEKMSRDQSVSRSRIVEDLILSADPAIRRNHAAEQLNVTIGRDLYAARIHAGLTQTQLALKIGSEQTTVSQAESGRLAVSEAYVLKVLRACGVPSTWGRKDWE